MDILILEQNQNNLEQFKEGRLDAVRPRAIGAQKFALQIFNRPHS